MALGIFYWILGFCFILFCIKMVFCSVGCISSAGQWFEDTGKMRAVPPNVKLIFCLQFGVSFASANTIKQGFYPITNVHFKMETCFCINEFLEHRCWGKESQNFGYVYLSYHYHFKVFFLLFSLASFLIQTLYQQRIVCDTNIQTFLLSAFLDENGRCASYCHLTVFLSVNLKKPEVLEERRLFRSCQKGFGRLEKVPIQHNPTFYLVLLVPLTRDE